MTLPHLPNPLPIFLRLVLLFRRWNRPLLLLVAVSLSLDILLTIQTSRVAPSLSYNAHSSGEKIFIAGLHWNDEALIRSHWAPAVLALVQHLGVENVYVSTIEGGSWDNTTAALWEFDAELQKLGVKRSIASLPLLTHEAVVNRLPEPGEQGWIDTPRGKRELRRIPYLASLRNHAMLPLEKLAGQMRFDRVLWLNDVIFTTSDVMTLLATNNGNYAASCSLDFSAPPLYYDTFALRDSSGAPTVSMTWPYFLSSRSRSVLTSSGDVPVQSCWNGMVAFDAAPFYATPTSAGLKFRGLPDSLAQSHLEASECCLIHTDNKLSAEKGVYLNPNVRVAYNADAYKAVHPDGGQWPSRWQKVKGVWKNRALRWARWPSRYLERRLVQGRIDSWMKSPLEKGANKNSEAGAICTVDEMQVLVINGWKHL